MLAQGLSCVCTGVLMCVWYGLAEAQGGVLGGLAHGLRMQLAVLHMYQISSRDF